MSILSINKNYNLALYANPVMSSSYHNTKLLAILDYNNAIKHANIDLIQKQLYGYLPPGTSPKLADYTFYLFKYKDRDIVIADAWIIPGSVEVTTGINCTIRLDDVTMPQIAAVRDQLCLLGIRFEIL